MAKLADIQDLELELWLRQRNSGSIYWKTKDGREIPIKDMDNHHLANTLKMLQKHYEKEDFIYNNLLDIDPMDWYD